MGDIAPAPATTLLCNGVTRGFCASIPHAVASKHSGQSL